MSKSDYRSIFATVSGIIVAMGSTLKLKKRKVFKEDGRYLIYFTFEQEDPPGDDVAVDEQAAGVPDPAKPENGGKQ